MSLPTLFYTLNVDLLSLFQSHNLRESKKACGWNRMTIFSIFQGAVGEITFSSLLPLLHAGKICFAAFAAHRRIASPRTRGVKAPELSVRSCRVRFQQQRRWR